MIINYDDDYIPNPYAAVNKDGEWMAGATSKEYLQTEFGKYQNIEEAKNNAQTEGMKKFLQHLYDKGILK